MYRHKYLGMCICMYLHVYLCVFVYPCVFVLSTVIHWLIAAATIIFSKQKGKATK